MQIRRKKNRTETALVEDASTETTEETAPKGRLRKWAKRGVVAAVIATLGSIALANHKHSAN